jgi:hypothetical protein
MRPVGFKAAATVLPTRCTTRILHIRRPARNMPVRQFGANQATSTPLTIACQSTAERKADAENQHGDDADRRSAKQFEYVSV